MIPTYISIEPRYARLGNWMFQYAAAKTRSAGGPVVFVVEDAEDRRVFECYRELFPEPIVDRAPDGVEVDGELYTDPKYIDMEIARRTFKIPGERNDCVSIHVRRGDYMHLGHTFPFVGEPYLREAVARFGANRTFMVFSDDIPWCKRFFKGPQFIFSEGHTPLEDLYGMARCKDHICSNSTMSWWGARLGPGGLTIFPSMWHGYASPVKEWSSFYFEGSEVIHNGYTPEVIRLSKRYLRWRRVRYFFKGLRFWR